MHLIKEKGVCVKKGKEEIKYLDDMMKHLNPVL